MTTSTDVVVPFSSAPQSTMAVEPNKASIARTVDHEITMCLERIEEYAVQLWRLVTRMRDEELWIDLGFRTYREYLASVKERTGKVPAKLRAPIRKQLEEEGASGNEIAAVTGTDRRTVTNDRQAERVGKTSHPKVPKQAETGNAQAEPSVPETVDAEIVPPTLAGLPDADERRKLAMQHRELIRLGIHLNKMVLSREGRELLAYTLEEIASAIRTGSNGE